MKKVLIILMIVLTTFTTVFAQSVKEEVVDTKVIENLSIVYAPSVELEALQKYFAPLLETIPAELAKYGYTVNNIDLSIGTSQDIIAEGLASGTIDIGCIGAATFVLYEDEGITPFVQVARDGYPNDSEDISAWNTGNVHTDSSTPSSGSRSLIWTNILTETGKKLYEKATAGTLTWDDINSAQWGLGKTTSTTGYLLPGVWLDDNFGTGIGSSEKSAESLSKCTVGLGTSACISALIVGQVDVTAAYENALYESQSANKAFEQAYPELAAQGKTVQDIIKVIGVGERSSNEPFVAGTAEYMTPEFIDALQKVFMTLCNSDDPALNQPFRDMQINGFVVPDLASFDGVRKITLQ